MKNSPILNFIIRIQNDKSWDIDREVVANENTAQF